MMPSRSTIRRALLLLLLGAFLPMSASALPFGVNKVRHREDLQWRILETRHFEIHYIQECETLARAAVGYAEEAYRKVSRLLGYVPTTKIPLFLYGTPLEFQETNITPQYLPDGVGGFTEVFKNRVAVPMNGSYHEFEKVILHEIVHAFQYNLIYGEGWRSVNLFKAVFVPQWMMEGSAEWAAEHWESQGEMVLRDAAIHDMLVPLRYMESFGHFEQTYMAYKESQSILEYVAQLYGRDKVPLMLRRMAGSHSPEAVVKQVLGLSQDELYQNWHFYLKSKAWSRVEGMPAPERYGRALPGAEGAKAAAAPDGKRVALLDGVRLSLLDRDSGKRRTLLKSRFQTQGSGVAWSPDGRRLAFAAAAGGRHRLHLMEVRTRKVERPALEGLVSVHSPEWSPDGRYLVFAGYDHSTVDLYRLEAATGKVERLTQGRSLESWPRYAADGRALYFISESEGETELEALELGADGLPSGPPRTLAGEWGRLSSLWSVGGALYFTCDRDRRIFNLHRLEPGGEPVQMTHSSSDVIHAAPLPDAGVFYAGVYRKGRQELFEFQAGKFDPVQAPPARLAFLSNSFEGAGNLIASSKEAGTLPDPLQGEDVLERGPERSAAPEPKARPRPVSHLEVSESSNIVQLHWPVDGGAEDGVTQYRVFRATAAGVLPSPIGSSHPRNRGKFVDYDVRDGATYYYQVAAVNSVGEGEPSPLAEARPSLEVGASRDYGFRLSPDILLFIAGYDSSFGFVGGGVLQMSDYLGNHRLGLLGDTIPGVRTGLDLNYEFSLWRTSLNLRLFYYENFFRFFELESGGILNEYRNNEQGMDLKFEYPLNTTTRIEYGVGTQRFRGEPGYLRFSEGISNYFQGRDQWNVANYYRLSFVQDRRRASRFWPNGGHALNFTLLHALPVADSNATFANLLFEAQAFLEIAPLNRMVWANRVIGMTSQGPDPQTFFIGNDAPFQAYFTTLRGYGGGTFYGRNLALFNTELRYPLATHLNFPLHPLPFILLKDIEAAAFLDAGTVSDTFRGLETSPILGSVGAGIRFYNILYQRALVMLRFDVAWRLDRSVPPTFHFNVVPIF